ncbi:hypothetical protein D3C72_1739830 [compost metagenome]
MEANLLRLFDTLSVVDVGSRICFYQSNCFGIDLIIGLFSFIRLSHRGQARFRRKIFFAVKDVLFDEVVFIRILSF